IKSCFESISVPSRSKISARTEDSVSAGINHYLNMPKAGAACCPGLWRTSRRTSRIEYARSRHGLIRMQGGFLVFIPKPFYTTEFLFGMTNTDRSLLNLIDAALKRIQADEYGVCANCQEEMQQKRLEAVPWAKHCIACQEKMEQGLL